MTVESNFVRTGKGEKEGEEKGEKGELIRKSITS